MLPGEARLATSNEEPLVVDLDGTLVRTDTLHEQLLRICATGPLRLVSAAAALGGGRARFKERVASMAQLAPEGLPYNEQVLEFIRAERSRGRKVILATAAHETIAQGVAEHLDCFDGVLATTSDHNLKGSAKAQAIASHTNGAGFDYIGNAPSDRAVWQAAGRALVVAPSDRRARSLARSVPVQQRFDTPKPGLKTVLKAMRIHQWAKNMLLFAPLFLARKWMELDLWILGIMAFVSFGLCASATYLWNDLLDLPADRVHRSKKNRPLASGALSIPQGVLLSAGLLLTSFVLAGFIGPAFMALLVLYIVTTVSYSFVLKKKPIADVVTLGLLYGLRIFAGGVAMSVVLTDWLLVFSLFFFLSLGFMKRLADLPMNFDTEFERIAGRGYAPMDRQVVISMGIAAGYCSIIIMTLYIREPTVVQLYPTPQFLWVVCLALLYWLSRTWILAARGHIPDDPVVFALKDKISLLCGVVTLVFILAAGMPWSELLR